VIRLRQREVCAGKLSNARLDLARACRFLVEKYPDERCDLAGAGDENPANLEKKYGVCSPIRRPALGGRFAAQWLNCGVWMTCWWTHQYPNYDESMTPGCQQETEMFVRTTLREDRNGRNY